MDHFSSSLPPVVLTNFTLIGKSLVAEACTLNFTDDGFELGPASLCRIALTTGPILTLHCGFCRKVGDVKVPPLFLDVNSTCNYYAPQHGECIHDEMRPNTNSLRFHRSRQCGIERDWAVGVDSEGVSYVIYEIGSWRKVERRDDGY